MSHPEEKITPAQPELADMEAGIQELTLGDAEEVRGGLIGLLKTGPGTLANTADKQNTAFADGSVFNAQKVVIP